MTQPELLFLVGVQRSGTTLLRNILHSHSKLAVMYDCAFYKLLADKYEHIDLSRINIDAFLGDLYSVDRFKYQGISREILKEHLLRNCRFEDYARTVTCITNAYRKEIKPDATVVGIKNPNGIYHLPFIFKHWPDAKVIHIIRDARAIYSSEKKKISQRKRFQAGDHLWVVARAYNRAAEIFSRYRDDPRFFHVKYDDLILNLESCTRQICEWLNVEWSEDLLNFDRIARAEKFIPAGEMWQHRLTIERLNSTRLFAYNRELTRRERESIELLQKQNLEMLGYPGGSGRSEFLTRVFIFIGYLRYTMWRIWKLFRRRPA